LEDRHPRRGPKPRDRWLMQRRRPLGSGGRRHGSTDTRSLACQVRSLRPLAGAARASSSSPLMNSRRRSRSRSLTWMYASAADPWRWAPACETSGVNSIEQGIRDHDTVIERLVALCSGDERIVAAFLGGSHARAEADEFSDLDLCLITTDEAYEEVVSGRRAIIEQLGEPLFLEDFGLEGIVFFILADGTEAHLFFRRASALDEIREVGPYRTLLDKEGVLAGKEFPVREPDRAEQVEALSRLVHCVLREPHPDRTERRGAGGGVREAGSSDLDDATLGSADELLFDGEARDASSGGQDRELLSGARPRRGVSVRIDLPRRARRADVGPSRHACPGRTLTRVG